MSIMTGIIVGLAVFHSGSINMEAVKIMYWVWFGILVVSKIRDAWRQTKEKIRK